MCGIAGCVAVRNEQIDTDILKRMTLSVAHRGPDDGGVLVEGKVGLGHRRLAIIDLSRDGHQPMTKVNSGLSIVFNGEIYNYLEIREELRKLGNEFYTASDTEVVLVAYATWGDKCVSRFNGMWAFAIFDRRQKRIFCSRDRFGVKPFYYIKTKDVWAFGSEIRQLLPLLPAKRANLNVVKEFLFAGITEPYEETFFEGVKKLPGGHNLVYDVDNNSFSVDRFYYLQTRFDLVSADLDKAVEVYGGILSNAVSLRLRADVTVGTCLSGGLDSSSVASLAAESYQRISGESFYAVTAVSELSANDESAFAKCVASYANLKWLPVKPTYEDFASTLGEVVRAQEEPFSDPSICMQFFVMRKARQYGITVLLDGQGGDETLLGYDRYYVGSFLAVMRRLGVVKALRLLVDCWRNNSRMSPIKILLYLLYFSSARARFLNYCYRNRYLRSFPPLPQKMRLNSKAIWNIEALQEREIVYDNLPALLRYEDKNSMWHAVETRLPFIDYRAVEAAISLPAEVKISGGWTKYILRLFMNNKMPPEVTWRKSKLGFEAPSELWLAKHGSIMHKEVMSSRLLQVLVKQSILDRIYFKLDNRTRWRLYSVALWEKEFSVVT